MTVLPTSISLSLSLTFYHDGLTPSQSVIERVCVCVVTATASLETHTHCLFPLECSFRAHCTALSHSESYNIFSKSFFMFVQSKSLHRASTSSLDAPNSYLRAFDIYAKTYSAQIFPVLTRLHFHSNHGVRHSFSLMTRQIPSPSVW